MVESQGEVAGSPSRFISYLPPQPGICSCVLEGEGGLLVASHSLLRQSIITGVGWFSCPFSLQSNAGC